MKNFLIISQEILKNENLNDFQKILFSEIINLSDNAVNISAVIKTIGDNFSQIPKYEFDADYHLIPKSSNASNCQTCRFKELCS